ncbi:Arf-Gap With Rho-Gap Domain, Ank Repeat And Ph Domain-Containing Protein 1 [Manis pentadactyla]|nr:Arf-Gap With Rho-Gap Domain, Ank Repeat And Ph Domain-Containing Protein 1 [Manis pentadactyla]
MKVLSIGRIIVFINRCALFLAIYLLAGMQRWWLMLENPCCDCMRKTRQWPELTLPIAYVFLMHDKNARNSFKLLYD